MKNETPRPRGAFSTLVEHKIRTSIEWTGARWTEVHSAGHGTVSVAITTRYPCSLCRLLV